MRHRCGQSWRSPTQQRNGLWWPENDRVAYELLRDEVDYLSVAAKYCDHRRVALQAGGNCGIYPLYLSDIFTVVITFEPERQNYACLLKNIENRTNIIASCAALGDSGGLVGIMPCERNNGASYVVETGRDVPKMAIDDLGLDACDLIQLDVEGYEVKALQGASQTINRCRPVIMVEDRGHGARYGTHVSLPWIEHTFGYKRVCDNGTDYVLVKDGNDLQ